MNNQCYNTHATADLGYASVRALEMHRRNAFAKVSARCTATHINIYFWAIASRSSFSFVANFWIARKELSGHLLESELMAYFLLFTFQREQMIKIQP